MKQLSHPRSEFDGRSPAGERVRTIAPGPTPSDLSRAGATNLSPRIQGLVQRQHEIIESPRVAAQRKAAEVFLSPVSQRRRAVAAPFSGPVTGLTRGAHETCGGNASAAGDPSQAVVQLRRYQVKKNIDLKLATKPWKAKPDQQGGVQKGVVRARGQEIADLRVSFPCLKITDESVQKEKKKTPEGVEELDKDRGEEFIEEKLAIFEKYDGLDDDVQGVFNATRPAIYQGAPSRGRNGTAADKINGLVRNDPKFIGAHLIKREWGGADNMWNVVSWTQDAENHWAKNFEKPVDSRGARGDVPGAVSISVTKEDDFISRSDLGDELKRVNKDPQSADEFEKQRDGINAAMESVPVSAIGQNYVSTTSLNEGLIGFTAAGEKAKAEMRDHVTKSDGIEAGFASQRGKIRSEHWDREVKNYEAGGKDMFQHSNTVLD
jgi:hypothetical protein